MRVPITRTLASVIGLATLASLAYAQPRFVRQLTSKYPHLARTKLADCRTCHEAPGTALNAYGKALRDSTMRYAAIERLDSDRDGVSNGKEIQALTFPGDASDRPGQKPKGDKTPPDSLAEAPADSTAGIVPDSLGATPRPPDAPKGDR